MLLLWFGETVPNTGVDYDTVDLTTAVSYYLETLWPGDPATEFAAYIETARADTGEEDTNTAVAVDLMS